MHTPGSFANPGACALGKKQTLYNLNRPNLKLKPHDPNLRGQTVNKKKEALAQLAPTSHQVRSVLRMAGHLAAFLDVFKLCCAGIDLELAFQPFLSALPCALLHRLQIGFKVQPWILCPQCYNTNQSFLVDVECAFHLKQPTHQFFGKPGVLSWVSSRWGGCMAVRRGMVRRSTYQRIGAYQGALEWIPILVAYGTYYSPCNPFLHSQLTIKN